MKNLTLTILSIALALLSYSQCNLSITSLNQNLPNCSMLLTVSGEVQINAAPPLSGYLIAEDCQGNRDTISEAPFTIGSYNYSLESVASGQNCQIEVFFSDLVSCNDISNFTLQEGVEADEAGTFNVNLVGNSYNAPVISTNKYILCAQDTLIYGSNQDFSIRDLSIVTPDPNDNYNPGIAYLIYECEPYILNSETTYTDSCLIGVYLNKDTLIGSITHILNNSYFLDDDSLPNNIYVVPWGSYFFSEVGPYFWASCSDYSFEDIIEIEFLNPIEFSISQTCTSDTAEIAITGGYPEFYPATEFTASNLSTGFFINNTCGHNGTIKIGGLAPGEIFSLDIVDENGCPVTYTNQQNAGSDSLIVICEDDVDSLILNNYLNGQTTGVWDNSYPEFDSITSVMQTNGLIGNYNFTYQVGDSCFQDISNFTLQINALPNITIMEDSSICEGDSLFFATNSAGTVVWSDGIVENSFFTPNMEGYYSVEVESAEGCMVNDSLLISFHVDPTLTLGNSFLVCHGSEAVLTSVSSGTVTWEDGIVDGVPFTPDSTNYYVANAESLNGCITTDSILIEVEQAPEYEFVITDTVYCPGEIIDVSINNGTNCSIILGLDTVTSTSCTAQFQFDEDGCHELSLIDQTINGCEWDTTFIYSICVETGSDAGVDSSIVISNVVSVDLDDYLTGDVNGSWTPYTFTGLGSFDHTTGLLDVSGADTGDYVFEYIVDSCGLDTAYIYVHVDPFAGINESFIDDVSIYPNPADDKININCSACIPIKIIDANGKEVQVLQGIKKVDISKLSPGMYYSIIQSYSGKIISMKFLVK